MNNNDNMLCATEQVAVLSHLYYLTPDQQITLFSEVHNWQDRVFLASRWSMASHPPKPGVPGVGCVYFIKARGTDRVKIGWTNDLKKRLANLQTASPFRLKVLLVLDESSRSVEKSLHDRFATARVCGEWFLLTGELKAIIRQNLRLQANREAERQFDYLDLLTVDRGLCARS